VTINLGFFAYWLIFNNRFPECKKAHAMKRTGKKRLAGGTFSAAPVMKRDESIVLIIFGTRFRTLPE
jgi:hypothetical protein